MTDIKSQIIDKSSAISVGLVVVLIGVAIYIAGVDAQGNVNTNRIDNLEATVMPREVLELRFEGINNKLDTLLEK